MKAILVMFDSLNRHLLPPYGCDWMHAPNFQRLADRAMVYDQNYVGSLPCIPARRELHTGRYNFLHRSWGPLEPFDDSMPQLLKERGIYTHLVTDHMHYFEEGGATYHQRYNTWEVSRGQEADPWKANVYAVRQPGAAHDALPTYVARDRFNRKLMAEESQMPQAVTFANGIAFLEANHDQDNWFLTVETFDPHEPFFVPEHYKALYPWLPDSGVDWPGVDCRPEDAPNTLLSYAALLSMCDHHLGKLLDCMDRHQLWQDTLLILCTDHGYMLGEHGYIGKVPMPGYRQVCNTPLFVWDPKAGRAGRSNQLTQTIDIPATILAHFGVPLPRDMQGIPIVPDAPRREGALFGVHSLYTCVADGRYIYMKAPDAAKPVFNYTLMPTHMHGFFQVGELQSAALTPPLSFTKEMPLLRCQTGPWMDWGVPTDDYLFDLQVDPEQNQALDDPTQTARLRRLMARLMMQNDAPPEYFERMGLVEEKRILEGECR